MDTTRLNVTIIDKEFEECISPEAIRSRIGELAEVLNRDYAGKDPVVLSVLKGAFVFTSDLVRELDFDPEVDFVRVSSYEGGTASTGKVRELIGLDTDIKGKDVIIMEDIVDTGLTLNWLRKHLASLGAASSKIVTLLFKEEPYRFDTPPEYVGFVIPNEFVVGYGLDYGQRGRYLKAIYKLK